MWRRGWIAVSVLALALVTVSCSDDGDGEDDAADGEETPEESVADITVVNLNVLHGLPLGNCPDETESCNAAARVDMMFDLLEQAGCPDIVGLQELAPAQFELIPAGLPDVCDGAYELVSERPNMGVEQWVLSSLPVLDAQTEVISGITRTVPWVRLDSALGPIDFYTTHFVAGIDNVPCAENQDFCPGIAKGLCDLEMETGECNPLETVDFIDRTADPNTLTILTGDLNATIDEPRITTITDEGFVDVWTLAGNDECDPETAENCTSGQTGDGPFDGLDIPDNTRDQRIDFVLVRAPDDCDLRADGPDDPDGDGTSTGMFAGEPFDPPVDGVYWVSDHTGVQADLSCG